MPEQMLVLASMPARVTLARRRCSGTASSLMAAPVTGSISSGAPSPGLERLRRRRADLGLPSGDGAALLIDPETGAPVREEAIPLHLRRARVTRAGIEANTSICSGMFRQRYPDSPVRSPA